MGKSVLADWKAMAKPITVKPAAMLAASTLAGKLGVKK